MCLEWKNRVWHVNVGISWPVDGRRKRGRPEETWRGTTKGQRKDLASNHGQTRLSQPETYKYGGHISPDSKTEISQQYIGFILKKRQHLKEIVGSNQDTFTHVLVINNLNPLRIIKAIFSMCLE